MLFYHCIHKVPSFLEFITSKSEYIILPKLLCTIMKWQQSLNWRLSLDLFNYHTILSDEQLYLLLTIVLSFSENKSFMKCMFSMNVNEVDYSFFTKKTDPGDWTVGCLLMVLMIDIISKHIHKPDVGTIIWMRIKKTMQ